MDAFGFTNYITPGDVTVQGFPCTTGHSYTFTTTTGSCTADTHVAANSGDTWHVTNFVPDAGATTYDAVLYDSTAGDYVACSVYLGATAALPPPFDRYVKFSYDGANTVTATFLCDIAKTYQVDIWENGALTHSDTFSGVSGMTTLTNANGAASLTKRFYVVVSESGGGIVAPIANVVFAGGKAANNPDPLSYGTGSQLLPVSTSLAELNQSGGNPEIYRVLQPEVGGYTVARCWFGYDTATRDYLLGANGRRSAAFRVEDASRNIIVALYIENVSGVLTWKFSSPTIGGATGTVTTLHVEPDMWHQCAITVQTTFGGNINPSVDLAGFDSYFGAVPAAQGISFGSASSIGGSYDTGKYFLAGVESYTNITGPTTPVVYFSENFITGDLSQWAVTGSGASAVGPTVFPPASGIVTDDFESGIDGPGQWDLHGSINAVDFHVGADGFYAEAFLTFKSAVEVTAFSAPEFYIPADTISALVAAGSGSHTHYLIEWRSSGNAVRSALYLYYNGSQVIWRLVDNLGATFDLDPEPGGRWIQIETDYSVSGTTVYIDGNGTGPYSDATGTVASLHHGASNFPGAISDYDVWMRAIDSYILAEAFTVTSYLIWDGTVAGFTSGAAPSPTAGGTTTGGGSSTVTDDTAPGMSNPVLVQSHYVSPTHAVDFASDGSWNFLSRDDVDEQARPPYNVWVSFGLLIPDMSDFWDSGNAFDPQVCSFATNGSGPYFWIEPSSNSIGNLEISREYFLGGIPPAYVSDDIPSGTWVSVRANYRYDPVAAIGGWELIVDGVSTGFYTQWNVSQGNPNGVNIGTLVEDYINPSGDTFSIDQFTYQLWQDPGEVDLTDACAANCGAGQVFPLAATLVEKFSVQLNGTGNPGGVAMVGYFEWGPTTAYGNTTVPQALGAGTDFVNFGEVITGLTASRTYHFRAVMVPA